MVVKIKFHTKGDCKMRVVIKGLDISYAPLVESLGGFVSDGEVLETIDAEFVGARVNVREMYIRLRTLEGRLVLADNEFKAMIVT